MKIQYIRKEDKRIEILAPPIAIVMRGEPTSAAGLVQGSTQANSRLLPLWMARDFKTGCDLNRPSMNNRLTPHGAKSKFYSLFKNYITAKNAPSLQGRGEFGESATERSNTTRDKKPLC